MFTNINSVLKLMYRTYCLARITTNVVTDDAVLLLVFVLYVLRSSTLQKHKGFMTTGSMIANSISVIVAYIPEGLPLALSMGLTIIARRLCFDHSVLLKRMVRYMHLRVCICLCVCQRCA
jgi:hypothetical protein